MEVTAVTSHQYLSRLSHTAMRRRTGSPKPQEPLAQPVEECTALVESSARGPNDALARRDDVAHTKPIPSSAT